MMLITRQGYLLSWPPYQSLCVGKWFTKLNVTVKEEETSQESDQENKDRWRYCRKGMVNIMVLW